MSKSDLKPCPFCGSPEVHIVRDYDYEGASTCVHVSVECRKCRARSGSNWYSEGNDCPKFYEEIRDRWNTRTTAPEVQENKK